MKVAIVGAGITGLTAAYHLQKLGIQPTVYEASDHVGGVIRTVRRDGYLAEHGPHTMLESNETLKTLVDELGLGNERIYASDESKKRFVVHDGQPKALPMSPPGLLRTDVFSTQAKLRALREPFVPRREDGVDESLTNFVARRFGEGLLNYGFELLVNGIWAGDPNRLSVQHAFPKMYALEREHGSVFRGAIAAARTRTVPRPRMLSFREGNDVLPRALASRLDDLRLGTSVETLRRAKNAWKIGNTGYDAVVLTFGPASFARLKTPSLNLDLDVFREIASPAVTVVTLGFRRRDVSHPLDGFGMIAPLREGLDILGTLFTSTLFEGRAPQDHVTLASFVGGLRRPDLASLSPDEKVAHVLRDLRKILGVRGEPTFVEIAHHAAAIPQYEVGFGRLAARMDAMEKANRGLYIAGNVRQGVAVPDLIAAGARLSSRLVEELR